MFFLRVFISVWLAMQFTLPLLPQWGVFVPHDHIARGRVDARAWQAHDENHRNPKPQAPGRADTNIISIATNNGVSSVFAPLDVIAFPLLPMLLTACEFSAPFAPDSFFARTAAFRPLVPPPNG